MISVLRADNPGPMTLDGTNTWLVLADVGLVVVDPGPDLADHREAILAAGPVELIVLTHRHLDHSDLAHDLSAHTRAPVRAADPDLCRWAEPLHDGDQLPGGLEVITTPGHTDDSICLLQQEDRAILTGDTVLGRGSSVIAHGEGSVAASLASLAKLAELVDRHQIVRLLPGHGPEVGDPADRLAHDIAHRNDRIGQVARAVNHGATDVRTVTDVVHPGLEGRLLRAAQASIAAHLAHLGVLADDDPWRR